MYFCMCELPCIKIPKKKMFFMVLCHRLQNSERERRQNDEADKTMRVELEGKVDALQKQLTDLDALR